MSWSCCFNFWISLVMSGGASPHSPFEAVSRALGAEHSCTQLTCRSIGVRHSMHFFINEEHISQATKCPHGSNNTLDLRSLHTRHSSMLVRVTIVSLHRRHFLHLDAQSPHATTCRQGENRTERWLSEHTKQYKHSSIVFCPIFTWSQGASSITLCAGLDSWLTSIKEIEAKFMLKWFSEPEIGRQLFKR